MRISLHDLDLESTQEYQVELSDEDRETLIYLYIEHTWPWSELGCSDCDCESDCECGNDDEVSEEEMVELRARFEGLEERMDQVVYQLDTQKTFSASWLRNLIQEMSRELDKTRPVGYLSRRARIRRVLIVGRGIKTESGCDQRDSSKAAQYLF